MMKSHAPTHESRRWQRGPVQLLILIAAILALILAACAADDEPVAEDPDSPAPTDEPVAEDPDSPAPTDEPVAEDPDSPAPTDEPDDDTSDDDSEADTDNVMPARWVAAITVEPDSLDPVQDFSTGAQYLQAHLFDPLVDFEGPDLEPTPRLATEWSSPEPTIWEFKLREGVTFHDGTPFDADDVAYTFEQGQKPDSRMQQFLSSVTELEVVDSHTIRMHTEEPNAPLLASLTNFMIIPNGAYDNGGPAEFGRNAVGTGLYRIASWDRGSQLALEAYPDRWRNWDIPDELVIRIISEDATRIAELQTGGVDMIEKLPLEQAQTLETDPNIDVVSNPGVRQVFWWLNALDEDLPLQDKRVRQAINYAIDENVIVENILMGRGEVRATIFGEGMDGYDPNLEPFGRDLDRARELLEEAGYPDGFDLRWNAPTGVTPRDSDIMEFIANQLGEVGINVTLDSMDFATNVEQRFASPIGTFEVAVSTYGRVCDSDIVTWGLFLHSSQSNYYNNEELDELMEAERRELDPQRRTEIFQEIGRVLHEDPAHVYLYAYDEIYATAADSGWQVYPFRCNGGFTYLMPFQER